jgi:hypothetical protein
VAIRPLFPAFTLREGTRSRASSLSRSLAREWVAWLGVAIIGRASSLQKRAGDELSNDDRPQDWLARNPRRFDKILAKTRERGYAARKAAFTGGDPAAS